MSDELPPTWESRMRCGSCLWPVSIHLALSWELTTSTIVAQHDGQVSAQAIRGDWRELDREGIRAVLQTAITDVCARTMCMEYGGQRVDA